jgi:hypothetical protein
MGFWDFLEQLKFYTLTLLDLLNLAWVDIVLVMLAHLERPEGLLYRGTYKLQHRGQHYVANDEKVFKILFIGPVRK